MQIIHWLLKVAHDQARDNGSSSNSSSNNKTSSFHHSKANNSTNEGTQQQNIVLFKHCGSRRRRSRGVKKEGRFVGWQNFSTSSGLPLGRKDVAKACFYSTLNLRRVGNSSSRQERRMMISMKMKKEELAGGKKPDTSANNSTAAAHHVGNKVLPISNEANAALPPRFPLPLAEEGQKRDTKQVKGDSKTKAISRMKELIRWAAAASKSDKNGKFLGRKVLHQFRNRGALKAMQEDSNLTGKQHNNSYKYNENSHTDSPRFSLRWEVESCSTPCSAMSMASCPAAIQDRKANWITTDSDFVVLEL